VLAFSIITSAVPSIWLADFRYAKNDSVLVVTRDDYKVCRGDRPALRLDGGEEARFRLERSGPLYFISGAPGHCDAGQRLTVRVMAQHDDASSSPADAPAASTRPGSGSGAVTKTPPRGKAGDGKTSAAAASVRASVGDVLSQPLGFVAERHFVEHAAGVREGRPAATAARQSTRARAPPGEARGGQGGEAREARRGRERRGCSPRLPARGEVESGGRRGDDGDPACCCARRWPAAAGNDDGGGAWSFGDGDGGGYGSSCGRWRGRRRARACLRAEELLNLAKFCHEPK
jgi:hypothetical protein